MSCQWTRVHLLRLALIIAWLACAAAAGAAMDILVTYLAVKG